MDARVGNRDRIETERAAVVNKFINFIIARRRLRLPTYILRAERVCVA